MNDNKNFEIHLPPGESDKPHVIIIREGEAAQINEPQQYRNKSVTLGTIVEYVTKRKWPTDVKDTTGLIVFSNDPDNAHIILMDDPKDKLATVLEAHLRANPDLTAFGINTGKTFSQKDLELFIKKFAHCFESVATAKDLIKSLQNFEARYEQIVNKEDDRNGNKADSIKSAIKLTKGELPKELALRLPLFYGTQPVSFTVEVEVDKLPNNLPGFSFYSLDLEIQRRELAKKTIDVEMDKLRPLFPLLEV